MASKQPGCKGQAWFCTTGLPSDVAIEVDGMTFHLHKFPLMGKSRKLHEMITEQEGTQIANLQTVSLQSKSYENDEVEEEIQEENNEGRFRISLTGFPGGCGAFETAAKFCYGVKLDLSAANVAALRCAGEYLELTEEYSEDNLISMTERFLAQSVLKNIKHSIKTLASCEGLLPMAENLGIVQRCIEVIATKAAAADLSLFGWPINGGAVDSSKTEADAWRKYGDVPRGAAVADSWMDELGFLSVHVFKRLIFAMKALNLSGDVIESCLMNYAKKFLPGISRTTTRKPSASSYLPSENDRRELLEAIISNLPMEKTSLSNANTTRFLFGLLRTSYILNASEVSRRALEKKIGSQLEQATLDDLLIPSYSYLTETLYDVDSVERILLYFLQKFEERSITRIEEEGHGMVSSSVLIMVGKLIDGYLSEIASDANLKPEKFFELAVTLPDHTRVFDDGLYRAVDVYLKAHPWISEADREKICGVLDCRKLTLEACTHAAQNERLPLRAVVQVLFFEQLRLRLAISGTVLGGAEGENEEEVVARSRAGEGNSTWRAAVRDNQVLRGDMDTMMARVQDLERECSIIKKTLEKIEDSGPGGHVENRSWWSKIGCKFKVCDSHEPTVVEGRRRHREN